MRTLDGIREIFTKLASLIATPRPGSDFVSGDMSGGSDAVFRQATSVS
jgi:hypothetical protein